MNDAIATFILLQYIISIVTVHFDPIILSPSGLSITGKTFTLKCSTTLVSPVPFPSDVPPPFFEWFYGPHGNASLPSGVIPSATVRMNGSIYSSTLLFLPTLSESHSGNYSCRLGAGRLVNSMEVSVKGMLILSCHYIPAQ